MTHSKGAIALIPSAGLGKRMSAAGKKNYLPLAGVPVLVRSIAAFDSSPLIDAIVVAVGPEDVASVRDALLPSRAFKKPVTVVAGGATRQESVLNAFRDGGAISYEITVVHDGARPLVTGDIIERALAEARRVGAAIAAVPVKDTIKEGAGGFVAGTLARERLWAVQTPQCFRSELLARAFEKAAADGFTGTDESSLVERTGARVAIVEGSYENVKITTADDMAVAEETIKRRAKAAGRP